MNGSISIILFLENCNQAMVLTHLFVHEYFKQICKTTFKNEVYIVCGMFFVPHEQYAIKMFSAQRHRAFKSQAQLRVYIWVL